MLFTVGLWTESHFDLRESKTVDSVRKHISKKRGVGVEGWEVGVHVRGLPMGHPRHDHLTKIRLNLSWRRRKNLKCKFQVTPCIVTLEDYFHEYDPRHHRHSSS